MNEIMVNMSVSIPNEIYKEFLAELVRDECVVVGFNGRALILSMPDIEPLRTPDGVQSLKLRGTKEIKPQRHKDKVLCKCGHCIRIVGTKWQHVDGELVTHPTCRVEIHYRERCYGCDCIDPKPAEG